MSTFKNIFCFNLLDRSPRYNRSKITQKNSDSIVQSIYYERRKTFLASLDTILRQIGCVNRRDITNQIDNIVINNLSSEREIYITKISEIITKDIDQNKTTFELMCNKLVNIADTNFHKEKVNQKIETTAPTKIFNDDTKSPLIKLLKHQLSQVNNIRGEIGIIKSSILSIISTFLSSLSTNHQQIKSQILHCFNEEKMKNDQMEIQLKSIQKATKEK